MDLTWRVETHQLVAWPMDSHIFRILRMIRGITIQGEARERIRPPTWNLTSTNWRKWAMQTSQAVGSEVIQVQNRGTTTLQPTQLFASNNKLWSNLILAPKRLKMAQVSLTLSSSRIPHKSPTTRSNHADTMHSNSWVNSLSKITLVIWHSWSHLVRLSWDQALGKGTPIVELFQTDKFRRQARARISAKS